MPLYLPNLNAVRFFAALTVVLSHVEMYRVTLGMPSLISIMGIFAGFGVDIFFALSGFLITYLLLAEHRTNGRIHIGHFYLRRIFRIWPLYFLILGIGVALELWFHESSPLLAPFNPEAFAYYLFFVPQVGKGFFAGSLCVAILWSIGVEELFYLVFPWLFRGLRSSPLRSLTVIIGVLLVFKVISIYALFKFTPFETWEGWMKVLSMTRFENLLAGAWMAFAAIRWKDRIFHHSWAILPIIGLIALLFVLSALKVNFYMSESIGPILQTVFSPFLVSLLVGAALCFLAFAPKLATLLEHPWLNYLGKISYGLYVYHCLALTFITMLPDTLIPTSWVMIFLPTLIITIVLAGVSYRFFEHPFLKRSAAYRHI